MFSKRKLSLTHRDWGWPTSRERRRYVCPTSIKYVVPKSRRPFKVSRASHLNQVCNGQFDKYKGCEFYIEQDFVKELKLDYVGGVMGAYPRW